MNVINISPNSPQLHALIAERDGEEGVGGGAVSTHPLAKLLPTKILLSILVCETDYLFVHTKETTLIG